MKNTVIKAADSADTCIFKTFANRCARGKKNVCYEDVFYNTDTRTVRKRQDADYKRSASENAWPIGSISHTVISRTLTA